MKHLLHLALVLIALNAAAQSNYQSGVIVKNNNDTLKGFINSKDKQFTINTIEFKQAKEDAEPTVFKPTDVKSFAIAPFYNYISYAGRISNNKNFYPDIDVQKDTTTTYASIFLQKVAGGPNATLYQYIDERKTRYFLKGRDSSPVELIYYEYGNPSEKPQKSAVFLGQLIEMYTRYNGSNDKKITALQSITFTFASLKDALAIINANVTEKNLDPSHTRVFIGASISNVSSSVKGLLQQPNSISATAISPKIGMGFDILTNPDVQKLIFRGEFTLSYFKPSYVFSYSPNGVNTIDNNKYSFSQYSISFIPQVIYNIYSTVKTKFFVGIGASANISAYQNNEVIYYNIASFSPYTLTPAKQKVNNSFLGVTLPLQAGFIVNKNIEINIIYTPPVNVVSSSNLTFSSIGAGMHYLFK